MADSGIVAELQFALAAPSPVFWPCVHTGLCSRTCSFHHRAPLCSQSASATQASCATGPKSSAIIAAPDATSGLAPARRYSDEAPQARTNVARGGSHAEQERQARRTRRGHPRHGQRGVAGRRAYLSGILPQGQGGFGPAAFGDGAAVPPAPMPGLSLGRLQASQGVLLSFRGFGP